MSTFSCGATSHAHPQIIRCRVPGAWPKRLLLLPDDSFPEGRESTQEGKIEGVFAVFLKMLHPRLELFMLAGKILAEHWDARHTGAQDHRASLAKEVRKLSTS